ncbi:thioredoxin reductase [Clostridiales bacterium PH28_bin88]|nr:thioredoxin reductase [Clostridiales bacterium PH28_bin88]
MVWDLLIIGAGPAGLTAGLYGARSGLKTLLLDMAGPGGQAATTDVIENYPGFPEGIGGPELMERFVAQATRFGLEIRWEGVQRVDFSRPEKVVVTDRGEHRSRAVIIASGTRPRNLDVPGEFKFRGRGVSYCATCDGAFFRGKRVVVVGGGDAAVEEGIFLTKFASQVVLVHRRDQLRAARVLQDRARANEKMAFRWNTVVDDILGEQLVRKVRLKNVKTGEVWEEDIDGVFVFTGTIPNTDFLGNAVTLNEKGYVVANDTLGTSIPGVFVAGDVREKFLRQVATAVGDGALAAMSAERYLAEQG